MLLTQEKSTRVAIGAGFLAIFLWALAPILMKEQATKLPIPYFLFLRYFISSLIFLPMLLKIRWSQLKGSVMLWLGLSLFLGLHLAFQVLALRDLPVSWYVVIFALNPVVTVVLLGQRWNRWMGLGFLLATLGSLFFADPSQLQQISLLGIFSLIVTMLAWSAVTFFIKKIQSDLNDWQVTGLCNVVSFIVFAGLWFVSGTPSVPLSSMDWSLIGLLSLGLPLAFYLFSYSLRHVPIIAIFSQFLEPVFGVLLAVLMLNEYLSSQQLIGAVLILGGAFQVLKFQKKEDAHV